MRDFTIISAQASVEASFNEPQILEGYGFTFFGPKGFTFSPVFSREHILIEFSGRFVHEVPDDKFTVVLKKVKGEESVPLFKTLTFRVNHIDHLASHNALEEHGPRFDPPKPDPCDHGHNHDHSGDHSHEHDHEHTHEHTHEHNEAE